MFIANLILLANTPAPGLALAPLKLLSHCQLPSLLVDWSYRERIPMQYNTSAEMYAGYARRVRSANKCTYRRNMYLFHFFSVLFIFWLAFYKLKQEKYP